MVPDLIDRMERWLPANRPDYYSRLRPGVDRPTLKWDGVPQLCEPYL